MANEWFSPRGEDENAPQIENTEPADLPSDLIPQGWVHSRAHPWRRYFARTLDTAVNGGMVFFVSAMLWAWISPETVQRLSAVAETPIVGTLLVLIAAIPVNALLIGLTGSSFGKLVFGVRVVGPDYQPMGFPAALKREVHVWCAGWGFGLPLVSLVTLSKSYSGLDETGNSTWDHSRNVLLYRSGIARIRLSAANLILRYWRGEYPLAVSFWVVGVVGLVMVLFLLSTYSIIVSQQSFTPYIALVLVAPLWIVSGIFALFHLAGTWRSAGRYLEDRRNHPRSAMLVWTAQTAAVGGVVAFVILFARLGLPSMQESLGIAFWNDPDIPAYSLRAIGETDLEIAGGLKYGVARDFEAFLAENPRVKVIHLNSPGGRLGEARKLAAIVRARGLTTYTATECASACTVVFAAGRERWMRKGAVLGYHAASFGGSDSPATMRDALIAEGVDKDFAARASQTASGSIWYAKLDDLLSKGVISGEVDPYKYPASGRGTPEKLEEGIKELLLSVAGFRAMEESAPNAFEGAVSEARRFYSGGMSEGDLMDEVKRARLVPFLNSGLDSAADETLVDFAELLADQLDSLGHSDVNECFDYAVHGTTEAIYDDLPYELTDREDKLLKEIMKTSVWEPQRWHPDREAAYRVVYSKVAWEYGAASVELLRAPGNVAASDKARYCVLASSMMREISKLPTVQAAEVMRDVLTKLYGR